MVILNGPAEASEMPRFPSTKFYAVRQSDSLEAPAIFWGKRDATFYLDPKENVSLEFKVCAQLSQAISYIQGDTHLQQQDLLKEVLGDTDRRVSLKTTKQQQLKKKSEPKGKKRRQGGNESSVVSSLEDPGASLPGDSERSAYPRTPVAAITFRGSAATTTDKAANTPQQPDESLRSTRTMVTASATGSKTALSVDHRPSCPQQHHRAAHQQSALLRALTQQSWPQSTSIPQIQAPATHTTTTAASNRRRRRVCSFSIHSLKPNVVPSTPSHEAAPAFTIHYSRFMQHVEASFRVSLQLMAHQQLSQNTADWAMNHSRYRHLHGRFLPRKPKPKCAFILKPKRPEFDPLPSFALVLYDLLQDAQQFGLDSIATWLPSGQNFQIRNPQRFVQELLPLYFFGPQPDEKALLTTYVQFGKLLLQWGFEGSRGVYFHKDFNKDNRKGCVALYRRFHLANKPSMNMCDFPVSGDSCSSSSSSSSSSDSDSEGDSEGEETEHRPLTAKSHSMKRLFRGFTSPILADLNDPPKNSANHSDQQRDLSTYPEEHFYHRQTWEKNFQDLIHFRNEHLHSNVPPKYKENVSLGRWVSHQRHAYKLKNGGEHSSLSDYREAALAKLGFVFDPTGIDKQSLRFQVWNRYYEELIAFYEKYGHFDVTSKDSIELQRWITLQNILPTRLNSVNGKYAATSRHFIEKLLEIGFRFPDHEKLTELGFDLASIPRPICHRDFPYRLLGSESQAPPLLQGQYYDKDPSNSNNTATLPDPIDEQLVVQALIGLDGTEGSNTQPSPMAGANANAERELQISNNEEPPSEGLHSDQWQTSNAHQATTINHPPVLNFWEIMRNHRMQQQMLVAEAARCKAALVVTEAAKKRTDLAVDSTITTLKTTNEESPMKEPQKELDEKIRAPTTSNIGKLKKADGSTSAKVSNQAKRKAPFQATNRSNSKSPSKRAKVADEYHVQRDPQPPKKRMQSRSQSKRASVPDEAKSHQAEVVDDHAAESDPQPRKRMQSRSQSQSKRVSVPAEAKSHQAEVVGDHTAESDPQPRKRMQSRSRSQSKRVSVPAEAKSHQAEVGDHTAESDPQPRKRMQSRSQSKRAKKVADEQLPAVEKKRDPHTTTKMRTRVSNERSTRQIRHRLLLENQY